MTTDPTPQTPALRQHSLVGEIADRFGVNADRFLATLRDTCFRLDQGEVTNAQMLQLLAVVRAHNLNPFTKELFAFRDKWGRVVPVVSVDGWSRIINDHPMFDGVEFRYADDIVTPPGGKPCPAWCEAVLHRKDRRVPIVVREYLDEVYQQGKVPGPWQTHTKRFLRHKALIQGARLAFGFAGIHDEDEAQRILDAAKQPAAPANTQSMEELASRLRVAPPAPRLVEDVPAYGATDDPEPAAGASADDAGREEVVFKGCPRAEGEAE